MNKDLILKLQSLTSCPICDSILNDNGSFGCSFRFSIKETPKFIGNDFWILYHPFIAGFRYSNFDDVYHFTDEGIKSYQSKIVVPMLEDLSIKENIKYCVEKIKKYEVFS